jgi:predicted metal-dependent phosphotriesterase family hydrolase
MLNRRTLLRLAASAGAGMAAVRFERLASAQPGAWLNANSGQRVSFPKDAVIRTVLEDVAPDRMPLGSTQIHEHLGGIFTPARPLGPSDIPPGVYSPPAERDYVDMMVDELKMSRAEGVACLVDAAAAGRRDDRTVENLKQIATRSGVLIVLGGGYYQDLAMNARYPADITRMPESELEEQFVRDAASQRWGAFGEIASSQPMQAEERKLLRAIGKAHGRTNLSIFTHTPHEGCPGCAVEQLDVFESVGVDPRRVCIGHLATIKPDAEPAAQTAKALAKRGAFIAFDTVGHPMGRSAIPEKYKVQYALEVLNAGLEDHLLLSADSTPVPQLKTNWGQGYSSVIAQFVPKLRYAGVKDATLHKILVDNPRRFLAFVPKR